LLGEELHRLSLGRHERVKAAKNLAAVVVAHLADVAAPVEGAEQSASRGEGAVEDGAPASRRVARVGGAALDFGPC